VKHALPALVAAACLAQAGASASQPPPEARGGVAVLRRDGVIFPFASFDKDNWRATWPLTPRLEVPVTLDAVPEDWWGRAAPSGWQAHLLDGTVRPLTLEAPALFWALCTPRIGVRTSYGVPTPGPPVPPEPFAKDGIAIQGGLPLEPIEQVDTQSAAATALVAQLLDKLNEAEQRTVSGVARDASWRHPVERNEREKLPFTLEAWYRSPAGEPGWTVSYIEAVRAYPPGASDGGCGLETLVSGWIHHRDGVLSRRSDLRGKVTYCDRVGATSMLPFGRVTPRQRSYWLFQLSGWENEWYAVAEIGKEKARLVVELPVGRCLDRRARQ
jgi:hypothetical protein